MDNGEVFDNELDSIEVEVNEYRKKKIEKLKKKYIKKLPIKKGDIIYNVTGIIKVETIEFSIGFNGRGERIPSHAIYKGIKYKWNKGGTVSLTVKKSYGSLHSYSELKAICNSKVV
jgi:hypothetical protein